MKVAICVPSHSVWTAGFGNDVAGLLLDRPKLSVCFLQAIGVAHAAARSGLVEGALKAGASHILWFDCDMRFPRDTLARLLARKRPIVGANYCARGGDVFTAGNNGETVKTTNASRGLEAVDKIGFGVMWTAVEVFKKIPRPWFLNDYDRELGAYMTEDVYFCRKAIKAGFKIYVDHDLSKEVCHTASLDLSFHMALSDEEFGAGA